MRNNFIMSRGYIFEMSTHANDIGFMSESDFYESIEALHVDYVRDLDQGTQDDRRREFIESLVAAGARHETVDGDIAQQIDELPDSVLRLIGSHDEDEDEDEDEDGDGDGHNEASKITVDAVYISLDVVRNYFRERFNRFKKLSSEITLDEFCEINPQNTKLWNTKTALHDSYGDVAYFNGCYYTMDEFMRNVPCLLESDDGELKVYIGNVVFMH